MAVGVHQGRGGEGIVCCSHACRLVEPKDFAAEQAQVLRSSVIVAVVDAHPEITVGPEAEPGAAGETLQQRVDHSSGGGVVGIHLPDDDLHVQRQVTLIRVEATVGREIRVDRQGHQHAPRGGLQIAEVGSDGPYGPVGQPDAQYPAALGEEHGAIGREANIPRQRESRYKILHRQGGRGFTRLNGARYHDLGELAGTVPIPVRHDHPQVHANVIRDRCVHGASRQIAQAAANP